MDWTFKNNDTCLFSYPRNIDSVAKLAGMYLYRIPCSLDERVSMIRKQIFAQCGSTQEKELFQFMIDYTNDQLLRERNSQWAPEIIRLLREEPNSYFFAFGAAHLEGEHRIQKFLEAAGFNVDYVEAEDRIDSNTPRHGFQDWLNWIIGLGIIVILSSAIILILVKCSAIECRPDDTLLDDLRQVLQILVRICNGGNRHLELIEVKTD